jgi:3-dehydroquinate synthetase
VIDLNLLDNLPQEQWNNGAAEIWKLGLVCKPEIFGRKLDIEQISEAIKTKASIVEKDPTDSGIRRILNFGHTIGHGIEKLSNYQFPHGLCVAIGSVAASHLSMQLGFLSAVTFEKIVDAYKEFPLSLPENYNRKDLFTAMAHDKKTIDQKIRFVLIDRIGHAIEFDGSYCKAVEEKDLKPTLQWMETWLCK